MRCVDSIGEDGGGDGPRTRNQRICSPPLCQIELRPQPSFSWGLARIAWLTPRDPGLPQPDDWSDASRHLEKYQQTRDNSVTCRARRTQRIDFSGKIESV